MTPVERVIRPIVTGQLRGFIKEHPGLLNCIGWFKTKLSREEVFVNSVAKRIILDLTSDETVGRLRAALLEEAKPLSSTGTAAASEDVAHQSASSENGDGGIPPAVPVPQRVGFDALDKAVQEYDKSVASDATSNSQLKKDQRRTI